ncbi:hypothetical protein Poli38472_002408 [Pythium oligandrum]|uniref:malate synthase n=1 Tax=Pythium oligandrum TaxID=41045 RepID=A0A8K1FL45_PYTOL|nr:hypothetical protein Poli38472_002408 [Pythium oligandrum]|eukprot:TMW63467.1 hypothetical protein Poli38472_002408 [Pythium oligandrum]
MERIERVQAHLRASAAPQSVHEGVFLAPCDQGLSKDAYNAVLTRDAVAFVADLAAQFRDHVDQMYHQRTTRRVQVEGDPTAFPGFNAATRGIRTDTSWTIDPLPPALHDRRVDIGDVSPAKRALLLQALNSGAQGVQVDFDDGHCPTWKNTVLGHHNIMDAVRGTLRHGSDVLSSHPALLMVRPRAWNMDETNMLVNGQIVPGALFDFALHLFHNGQRLLESGRGPFLYLPKLEGYEEAALWREVFEFAEAKLQLPAGCIKAVVLIESIHAAFAMDEILYELRHHSAGLNCGMWDYTASIVVNYRLHPGCILPDRQQYVSMKSPFLQHYMELLIETCKRRRAPATTGMVPFVLDQLPPQLSRDAAVSKSIQAKQFEASAGSDGALVFDLALVKPIQEVFAATKKLVATRQADEKFYEKTLMTLPNGDVSLTSVRQNLQVALSYVLAWLQGNGTVVVNGCVEDSATAEISRAQLWQWIRHQVPLTSGERVTASLVHDLLMKVARDKLAEPSAPPMRLAVAAINLVFRVITARSPPAFLTTFLLEQEPLTRSLESV